MPSSSVVVVDDGTYDRSFSCLFSPFLLIIVVLAVRFAPNAESSRRRCPDSTKHAFSLLVNAWDRSQDSLGFLEMGRVCFSIRSDGSRLPLSFIVLVVDGPARSVLHIVHVYSILPLLCRACRCVDLYVVVRGLRLA